MRVRAKKKRGKGVGNRKAAELWRRQSAEEREREGKDQKMPGKKEVLMLLRKKVSEQKQRASWRRARQDE